MPVYTKLLILLLFISIIGNAQRDSLALKPKFKKFEIGLVPVSLYKVPDYFANKINLVYVVGLQGKFYINDKNAIRLTFTLNNFSTNKSDDDGNNPQNVKQYSAGFQHTFFTYKKLNAYWFADLYYQTFSANFSTYYGNMKPPPGYINGTYDSTMFTSQKVNSYNLVTGVGFKLLDRKPLFISVESGLGLSYYNGGVQQVTGQVSAYYDNQYISSNGVQHTLGPSYNNYHQLPQVDTKVKGVNLNASVLRIVLGVVF